ncbi:membrane-bound PQQ-dependent dehydrogenase, glucose/quinate/shikimate family [Mangrovimicrobium sediminis]|uniref:Membrane-bound PQQ-dependent dehydrogenase, glucose/quinate/shikimate family n=1 Tax=Mangrovimicrobium sediminis TaxID=2562682 RepID=A0A4Z0LVU2_9GAMM|nr:membrane-bound PQQ-dependent dehydrogenase, glucose/quinate/shikimate family [Haliea sp. SAOS-164]TGD71307.1 membrane-bound PQQ-dependent dehydrogenase, glucose/quinate/shikimate family [Haliea sp. SAOS-164]
MYYSSGISRQLLGILLALLGAAFAWGGWQLLQLDGSAYYVATGVALLFTALCLFVMPALGAWLFGAIVWATLGWSLWEVGMDGWALVPRLTLLAVLALVFLLPGTLRTAGAGAASWAALSGLASLVVVGGAFALADWQGEELPSATVQPAPAADAGEWRVWGRNAAGDRFSPLQQIDNSNVHQLELAWRYDSDVPPLASFGAHSFEPTPLAANGYLYLCVDRNVVVALDPETGKERWRHDPDINLDGVFVTTCRGVSYYEAPPGTSKCPRRLIYGTADGRLLAVNADDGSACTSFGDNGAADMRLGMGRIPPGALSVTSPPAIVNGVAVVGQFVNDYLSFFDAPAGVIRGYDALSGELRWAWDAGYPVPRGLPEEGDSYTLDTPNAWSVFSADPERGLVFIPTGNSPPDYYGVERSAAALKYSSSIVALDAATGAVRWSFQTVHHDLWDYDVASQPVAVDIYQDGQPLPALIVPTKRGETFLLDRRDGTPIDPVVEKPVPQGGLPGEPISPTQPYTTGFPSLAGEHLTETDMWGMTALDQLWCRVRFRQLRYEGDFNPPSTDTTLNYPGAAGGSNWGSVSVDLDRGIMVASSLHMAETGQMITHEEAAALDLAGSKDTLLYPQERVPYAFKRKVFLSPLGAPCQRPPYGRISAFAIGSRELLWSKPLGTAEHSGPWGIETRLPITMGVPNAGGAITTGGGLVFIGAAQDRRLRALDIGNGRELWSARLPAVGAATPMTYTAPSGRQFVVIAAGGHPGIPGPSAAAVLAYALPR